MVYEPIRVEVCIVKFANKFVNNQVPEEKRQDSPLRVVSLHTDIYVSTDRCIVSVPEYGLDPPNSSCIHPMWREQAA